jgi:hypothetical protein
VSATTPLGAACSAANAALEMDAATTTQAVSRPNSLEWVVMGFMGFMGRGVGIAKRDHTA